MLSSDMIEDFKFYVDDNEVDFDTFVNEFRMLCVRKNKDNYEEILQNACYYVYNFGYPWENQDIHLLEIRNK